MDLHLLALILLLTISKGSSSLTSNPTFYRIMLYYSRSDFGTLFFFLQAPFICARKLCVSRWNYSNNILLFSELTLKVLISVNIKSLSLLIIMTISFILYFLISSFPSSSYSSRYYYTSLVIYKLSSSLSMMSS